MSVSGVYAIVSPSGKRYIGSAVNIKRRFREHRSLLKRGKHHCPGLQRAYAKYGATSLIFIMTDAVEPDQLLAVEQARIDALPRARRYNVNPHAGSLLGFEHSEATREHLSRLRKGAAKTQAEREAISKALIGRAFSDTHRQRIGAATRAREVTVAARESMRKAQTGRKHSEASMRKRSLALLGKKRPTNKSGHVGICQLRSGNWQASFTLRGKTTCVGTFTDIEAAVAARDVAIQAALAPLSQALETDTIVPALRAVTFPLHEVMK